MQGWTVFDQWAIQAKDLYITAEETLTELNINNLAHCDLEESYLHIYLLYKRLSTSCSEWMYVFVCNLLIYLLLTAWYLPLHSNVFKWTLNIFLIINIFHNMMLITGQPVMW